MLLAKSMTSTVLRHKEATKSANVAKVVKETMITDSERGRIVTLIWIKGKQVASDSVGEAVMYEQVKMLHADLKDPGQGLKVTPLRLGEGSSTNLKKCLLIH